MPGTLILCATPIGNLGDVSSRAADAIAGAKVVYAEDTRRTKVLLDHLGISVPMRSYFVGNEEDRSVELGEHLAAGDTVVLVTDAGMPGIADPGVSAVRAAVESGAVVTAIPGPSAVTAAVAVSGFASDRFSFEGFLPRKGASRRARLDAIAADDRVVVLFSAPSRLPADLEDLAGCLGVDRNVVVARELTKMHEEIWRGTIAEAVDHWKQTEARGEFTVVVAARGAPRPSMDVALAAVGAAVDAGVSLSAAVRSVAADLGLGRRELYEAALRSEKITKR